MFREKAIVLCNVGIVISCRVYFGAPKQFFLIYITTCTCMLAS